MKVLLIEDDPGIRDALQLLLENSGYVVSAYATGTDVMENDYQLPDIFIIDKQLSGIDGLDICRYVKASDNSKDIPVIIVSASPDTAKLAMHACADAFLEKPFKNKDLLHKMDELLKGK